MSCTTRVHFVDSCAHVFLSRRGNRLSPMGKSDRAPGLISPLSPHAYYAEEVRALAE